MASTRTHLYPRPEKFADYVFVSEGADVRSFRVLSNEVSDHAPLLLEFGM
jgi:endonuclease/exonuclease/phosphatase family metal-dependent hydrolase